MTAMFSDNAKKILVHLQANPDAKETALQIAEATGVPVKSVNGIVTASFQRRGYAKREMVEGTKVIVLTEEGKSIDPNMKKPI